MRGASIRWRPVLYQRGRVFAYSRPGRSVPQGVTGSGILDRLNRVPASTAGRRFRAVFRGQIRRRDRRGPSTLSNSAHFHLLADDERVASGTCRYVPASEGTSPT
jgi:hypothetical protein